MICWVNKVNQHFTPFLTFISLAVICLFKVDKENTRTLCEICSKKNNSKDATNFTHCSGALIVEFKQVNVNWGAILR